MNRAEKIVVFRAGKTGRNMGHAALAYQTDFHYPELFLALEKIKPKA